MAHGGASANVGFEMWRTWRPAACLGLSLAMAVLIGVACGGGQTTPGPTASPSSTAPLPSSTPPATPSVHPVSPTPPEATATLAPAHATATPDATASPATIYEVQAGDTVYSIARRFGTTVDAIVVANNLADASQIYAGQVLIIPTGAGPTSTPATARAEVVRKADVSDKTVLFTFDAGADAGFTAQILDTLKANGIVAGFGVTGRWAEQNPDLLRRIADEGHTIINHSYDHPSFTGRSTDLPPLTQSQRWEQLDKTESIIQDLAGVSTKPYFRPPYGDYDDSVNADLYSRGYLYNVMWTVDSLGWNGLAAEAIVKRCLGLVEPGAVFVFHVGSASQDAAALQAVIDGVGELGYMIGPGLQGSGPPLPRRLDVHFVEPGERVGVPRPQFVWPEGGLEPAHQLVVSADPHVEEPRVLILIGNVALMLRDDIAQRPSMAFHLRLTTGFACRFQTHHAPVDRSAPLLEAPPGLRHGSEAVSPGPDVSAGDAFHLL